MAYYEFLWTDEIIDHLAQHGVSPEDFERIVCHSRVRGRSRSSGDPVAWGYTDDGRYIIAVYELIDELTVLPVTAYEIEE